MPEPRDRWSKFEILASAISAVGSIAIPIVLFFVGNQISDRQRDEAASQLEADRVERMLAHLASPNAEEKRLAVRVVEFLVSKNELPGELLPAIAEIARSAQTEELSDSASQVLEKAANTPTAPALAAAAKQELSALPARLDVHTPAGDDNRSAPALDALTRENVVVRAQTNTSEPVKQTELRFYRKEDADQAKRVAASLADKGVHVELKDLSATPRALIMRPRKYDLLFAQ